MPRSEAENRCALDWFEAGGRKRLYLGVDDMVTEGKFIGVDGTCGPVPVSQSWYAKNEPHNIGVGQECTMIYWNSVWADIGCSHTYNALCQLRSCYQPQCP